MRKMQTPKWVKNFGLSTLVAGFVFLALPIATDASDFGDELLTEGIEDTHVETLQDLLIEEEQLEKASADGVYNNATTEAVKSFQEENGLLADGLAGPQTLGALKTLEEGDESALVEDLQETLEEAGHYNGDIDGDFDAETNEAVKNFQEAADISADGLAGPKTFGALYYETDAIEEEPEAEEAQEESSEEAAEEEAIEETTEAENEETSTEQTEQTEETEEPTSADADNESSSESPEGTTYQMEATAYTAECNGCSGITATGKDLRNDRNANVVAVDPNVIPLGSTVHVEGYGEAIAADTGGAINGEKIDLHVPTKEEATSFGRQNVEVTVLD
ncbi:peptidoglycan-binding protein [Salicibibacter cibarius]|uniref:Peptidoglycan-binding protein n=1 Tax=Salicibibacter cibarius TaxID=2743000 RepID=A0A7T7CB57_9BACI|nr:peptidoglycan-binding protein [Salicibibacter cibarius]QQK75528.1 peptidoglycan-binding protein [Salicibibacter cibarius]